VEERSNTKVIRRMRKGEKDVAVSTICSTGLVIYDGSGGCLLNRTRESVVSSCCPDMGFFWTGLGDRSPHRWRGVDSHDRRELH
jgi:hypothetical protein